MASTAPPATAQIDRRACLFGALLLAGAGLPVALRARADGAPLTGDVLAASVPEHIGDHRLSATSDLVMPTEAEIGDDVYDATLMRVYESGREPGVMLMIGVTNGQDSYRHVHRPEACYSSVGFTLGASKPVAAPGGVPGQGATFFTASQPTRAEHVLYWVRIGDIFPTDNRDLYQELVRDNLSGRRPSGALLRMSVRRPDADGALRQLQRFHAALMAGVTPLGRLALLGRGA